jgi:hypothetical protein
MEQYYCAPLKEMMKEQELNDERAQKVKKENKTLMTKIHRNNNWRSLKKMFILQKNTKQNP